MTPNQFRRVALSFPDSEERAHHAHPDFRVNGKIFATLGYPDGKRGMVQLAPEQQAEFVHDHPEVFSPVAGTWGRGGSTSVHLANATQSVLRRALETAYKDAIAKSHAHSVSSRAKPKSRRALP